MGYDLNKRGFSLIELMMVLAIIGLIAAFVVPNLTRRSADSERAQFVEQLNALVASAWQDALFTGHLHRVFFDLVNHTIEVQEQTTEGKFERVVSEAYGASVPLPERYVIDNFYINKKDEMATAAARATTWFFISSDGVAQPVTINISDREFMIGRDYYKFSLDLNPFSVQFVEHESYQRP